jgi:hypothetical protein
MNNDLVWAGSVQVHTGPWDFLYMPGCIATPTIVKHVAKLGEPSLLCAVSVVFSEVQLTLSEGSTGSIDLLILPSSLGELQADAQVSVTTVLLRQDGETGFVDLWPHLVHRSARSERLRAMTWFRCNHDILQPSLTC